jgi:hypothetical protein
MKKELSKAFSEQINKEYFSAFLYLAMSNYFANNGLKGAANWTYVQYQEELAHARIWSTTCTPETNLSHLPRWQTQRCLVQPTGSIRSRPGTREIGHRVDRQPGNPGHAVQ